MSNLPRTLPNTIEELALLIESAMETGFNMAREYAEVSQLKGWAKVDPYIYWDVAHNRLQNTLHELRLEALIAGDIHADENEQRRARLRGDE